MTESQHPSINTSLDRLARREFLRLGDPALDMVFGGGLPRGTLLIVTGTPGAGKTIFAQQLTFAAARDGIGAIYFTNVSEPHDKLLFHIQGFGFFEHALLGQQVQMYNITSQVGSGTMREAVKYIVETVRKERGGLVVIDSFRGLKHMLDDDSDMRQAIFELGAQLTLLKCTCVLVGEYTTHEIQTDPEFAIADGILHLWHAHTGFQERRALRIIKLRGVSYLGGEHSFLIDSNGLTVFPRQEALSRNPLYRATEERASFGIAALDTVMRGGLIRSSSTLLVGPAGAGKTLLALHFLAAATPGERGLMVSFQENPEQLRLRASRFRLGAGLGIEGDQADILSLSPVELDVDQAAAHIREAVERRDVRRVVIDSVAELELAVREPERFDDYLASLVGYLREREVTLVMTRELPQLFGSELSISSRGLSYIVDNIVLLRYVEIQTALRRAIAVLKSRGSDHDKELFELLINDGAITLRKAFSGYTQLMTGMPLLPSDDRETHS